MKDKKMKEIEKIIEDNQEDLIDSAQELVEIQRILISRGLKKIREEEKKGK